MSKEMRGIELYVAFDWIEDEDAILYRVSLGTPLPRVGEFMKLLVDSLDDPLGETYSGVVKSITHYHRIDTEDSGDMAIETYIDIRLSRPDRNAPS